MSLIDVDTAGRQNNPVDLVEDLAALNEWSFDRAGDDEITLSINGRWSDYHASFTWMDDIESLHLACAFDLKVPEPRLQEVKDLIQLINEQLWIGHLDLWPREGVVMFRHGLLLAGGAEASGRQCEAQLDAAVEACDRYYQAFQFVVWAGKSAREAMDSALFETAGEA
ncbi:YbjN domain-containing protein [Phreatobacter sp.]|uniref:YbjN domain-containing protein n=1 Tax=Phreatobacter sp. TaxID=1966341 RepID=UPI003F72E72D